MCLDCGTINNFSPLLCCNYSVLISFIDLAAPQLLISTFVQGLEAELYGAVPQWSETYLLICSTCAQWHKSLPAAFNPSVQLGRAIRLHPPAAPGPFMRESFKKHVAWLPSPILHYPKTTKSTAESSGKATPMLRPPKALLEQVVKIWLGPPPACIHTLPSPQIPPVTHDMKN